MKRSSLRAGAQTRLNSQTSLPGEKRKFIVEHSNQGKNYRETNKNQSAEDIFRRGINVPTSQSTKDIFCRENKHDISDDHFEHKHPNPRVGTPNHETSRQRNQRKSVHVVEKSTYPSAKDVLIRACRNNNPHRTSWNSNPQRTFCRESTHVGTS